MKMSRYNLNMQRILSLFSTLTALLALCACADGPGKLPDDVRSVVEATRSGKASEFAAVCSYPVERPYPLRDLTDSAAMTEYYNVLMDDSLRNVITQSSRSDWNEYGWRGWSVKDGEYIWIDGQKIYNIPYVSRAEREMIHRLADEEMLTLPLHMRRGWHPAVCLKSDNDGSVYRIDASDNDSLPEDSLYRICIYKPASSLTAEPANILMGKMGIEGSAGIRTFYFRDRNGDTLEYSPDDMDDDSSASNLVWKPVDGQPVSHRAKKIYWRDLL